ncbi:DUF5018 domain-containing protein [Tenacibaculum jejuense]|uniref:Probable lipoprotein containing leucine-rich repeats n=1 Tax=Tenacibaculum jejuense TaxID=584609 RepID=A0A238UDN8_9FLAO|nr:DUF5018 domain-containing protein [Tenacibaculum jejuense]SNR17136.1 Probable lipoprotein precursor containing leucine-rich repeats [Tenacibaculum jejuense]
MKFFNLAIAFFSLLLFFGCSEDNERIPPDSNQENLQILSFQFLAANNVSLSNDIEGKINEDEKDIYLNVPFNTSLTSLIPTITITDGAEIIPDINTVQDFSSPVIYLLSKDGYDLVAYSVIVTIANTSNEADISNFSFLKENNPSLSDNYEAIIENNEIKLQISEMEDLQSVIPTVEISEGASISPTIDTGIDFRNDVVFTVTSGNGETQKEYTVKIVTLKSVKDIVKFDVTVDNKTFEATIDNDLNKIVLKVPEGTDVTNLTPEILLSEEAKITPLSRTPQDFSNPVTYTITAEDGSEKEYTVYVSLLSCLELDRLFLEEFYRANERYNTPFTYLDWDLEAPTMENWNGVRVVDGRVSELVVAAVNINEVPESIASLDKLRVLTISGRILSSLPTEIGSLETLEVLTLNDNRLTTLPKEIGSLSSIRGIYLKNNLLEELPNEIGNLPDSFYVLNIKGNNLRELPVEISNIPNLISLNIQNNPLTIIPQAICDMTTSNGVGIAIVKDVEDECM